LVTEIVTRSPPARRHAGKRRLNGPTPLIARRATTAMIDGDRDPQERGRRAPATPRAP
jgi:hypothetical protein